MHVLPSSAKLDATGKHSFLQTLIAGPLTEMKNDACLNNYHSCSSLPPSLLARSLSQTRSESEGQRLNKHGTFLESNTQNLSRGERKGHTVFMQKILNLFFFCHGGYLHFLSVLHIPNPRRNWQAREILTVSTHPKSGGRTNSFAIQHLKLICSIWRQIVFRRTTLPNRIANIHSYFFLRYCKSILFWFFFSLFLIIEEIHLSSRSSCFILTFWRLSSQRNLVSCTLFIIHQV